jgi:hypothetical protein
MAKKKIARPSRDPDHYSKRMVPYWWFPEMIRGTSADTIYGHINSTVSNLRNRNEKGDYVLPCDSYGKIHAVKKNGDVELHMLSTKGNLTYIQGSIQQEFKQWHEERSIDYILLGLDPDDIIDA